MTIHDDENPYKFNPISMSFKDLHEVLYPHKQNLTINIAEQIYKHIEFNKAVLALAIEKGKADNVIEYIKESLAELQRKFDNAKAIPFIYDGVINSFSTSLHLEYIEKRLNEGWPNSFDELISDSKNET